MLKGRYHATLSVASRIVFGTRVFQATGVSNPEERSLETIVLAVELIGQAPTVDTSWIETGWAE